MTATISNYRGQVVTGDIKCWMGNRIVEIETPDGCRHVGRLRPGAELIAGTPRRPSPIEVRDDEPGGPFRDAVATTSEIPRLTRRPRPA